MSKKRIQQSRDQRKQGHWRLQAKENQAFNRTVGDRFRVMCTRLNHSDGVILQLLQNMEIAQSNIIFCVSIIVKSAFFTGLVAEFEKGSQHVISITDTLKPDWGDVLVGVNNTIQDYAANPDEICPNQQASFRADRILIIYFWNRSRA